MKIKKQIMIPLLIVFGILLAGWIGSAILHDIPDNFVSCALAEFSANLYKAQHHPASDYQVGKARYDEKSENYFVTLSSDASPDSRFSLEYSHIGILVGDSYKYRVTQRANTAIRLSNAYAYAVYETLTVQSDSAEFYRAAHLQYQVADGPYDDAHYIISGELELDGTYDLAELGAKAGYVWINVSVDSAELVTVENLAEILLYVRETLDQAGLPFYTIDCLFEYCNGTHSKRMDLDGFLYEDIYEEGLVTRLSEALDL